MARHAAYDTIDQFVPGDPQMVFSSTYGSDGVKVHLTELNAELTLSSSEPLTDADDATILRAYITLLEDAFEAMYGPL